MRRIFNCIHRQGPIDTKEDELCATRGNKLNIHFCDKYQRKCADYRYKHGQTERICMLCDDFTGNIRMQPNTVAVIITSHNYGQFLQDAIDSVRKQTKHVSEILVIADNCSIDDITVSVAQSNSVPVVIADFGNCYMSRRHGFNETESEFVVFLDADDMLFPNYVEECLATFTKDQSIGIVTSKLMMFGTRNGVVNHLPNNLERQNFIHAGSMVRRTALETTRAMEQGPCPHSAHEDWYIWRPVVRAGWRVASTGTASYAYRQHAASMMHSTIRHDNYFVRANLAHQPITLVLPICRERYWPRLRKWVAENVFIDSRFTELILINSGENEDFRKSLKDFCSAAPITTVVQTNIYPRISNLPDRNRLFDKGAYGEVQKIMPKIYANLRRATNEFIMIIEDDVLPPQMNCVNDLLQQFDTDVAAVSGTVPCRFRKAYAIAGKQIGSMLSLETQSGVEDVAYTGFGCLMLRRSALLEAAPFNSGGETGNFDIEFWRELLQKNWRLRLNWNVRCDHADQSC